MKKTAIHTGVSVIYLSAFMLATACDDQLASLDIGTQKEQGDKLENVETSTSTESDTSVGKGDDIEETGLLAESTETTDERDSNSDSKSEIASFEDFSFIVISDPHVRLPGNSDDLKYANAQNLANLNRAVEKINARAPDAAFVAVNGDLVGCLFSGNPDDYLTGEENPAEEFKAIMDNLLMPYHVALGNHDYQIDFFLGEGINAIDPSIPEAVWKKVLDTDPYFSFVYHQTRFIFLNSARGPARTRVCIGSLRESYCTGSFDDPQMEWFSEQLSEPEPAYLFFHHPVVTDHPLKTFWSAAGPSFQVRRDDPFYDVAKDFKEHIKGIFVGHGHVFEKDSLNGVTEVFETGAIGDSRGNLNNIRLIRVFPSTQEFIVARL